MTTSCTGVAPDRCSRNSEVPTFARKGRAIWSNSRKKWLKSLWNGSGGFRTPVEPVFAVPRWIRAKRTAASPESWQDWTVERGGNRGLLTG